MRLVRSSLDSSPPASTVVLSAAYLYEAASHPGPRAVHSDWLVSYRGKSSLLDGVISLKPARLILTQFDYYRRFEPVLRDKPCGRAGPSGADQRRQECSAYPMPDERFTGTILPDSTHLGPPRK